MKVWHIEFKQNGDEYSGMLVVHANRVDQIDGVTVDADGVTIILDEQIREISERAGV